MFSLSFLNLFNPTASNDIQRRGKQLLQSKKIRAKSPSKKKRAKITIEVQHRGRITNLPKNKIPTDRWGPCVKKV
jgi:hypothetical protein